MRSETNANEFIWLYRFYTTIGNNSIWDGIYLLCKDDHLYLLIISTVQSKNNDILKEKRTIQSCRCTGRSLRLLSTWYVLDDLRLWQTYTASDCTTCMMVVTNWVKMSTASLNCLRHIFYEHGVQHTFTGFVAVTWICNIRAESKARGACRGVISSHNTTQ